LALIERGSGEPGEPVVWYFDFISPFAYLHWPRVRALMAEREVALRPILFAGLLKALDHKGPAEIPGKREFTYRHAQWRAQQRGLPMRFPPAHPFNPLAALRLCLAAGATPEAVDALFHWIWARGERGDTLDALAPVAACLGVADPATATAAQSIREQLRRNTDEALAAGVFGVPTLALAGHLFWGEDAHDFALAALADPTLMERGEMARLAALPVGISRA
jgi:2-hydroxychromene-2-carboxylate isomerase